MTRVQIVSTGRVVIADDDVARRWIAEGYAVPVSVETASRTPIPTPAARQDIEHR